MGVDGYEPSTYGESFADVYDDWYTDIGDAEGAIELVRPLVARTRTPRVLELGVGTGRLAIPLAEDGVEVVGVDASPRMLQQLIAKRGAERSTVLAARADMRRLPFRAGAFGLVLAAFNTLFNLTTERAQRECLDDVARVLRPEGALLVETFVPADPATSSQAVEVRSIGVDHVVLTASRSDPTSQTVAGQHVEIREAGVRLRPWLLRYLTVDQIDALAESCGLQLEQRWAGWRGEPFTAGSDSQVSLYRPVA